MANIKMMEKNIFAKFCDNDLERLILCLQKIKTENLIIDADCQININTDSGDVYIWSQNWRGYVYCDLQYAVKWNYICNRCGIKYKYDFNSEAECREYANKHLHSLTCDIRKEIIYKAANTNKKQANLDRLLLCIEKACYEYIDKESDL